MMIKDRPFITPFTCSIKAFAFSLHGNFLTGALTRKGRDGISDCWKICSGRIVIHIRMKWKWQYFSEDRQIYGKHRLQSLLKLGAQIPATLFLSDCVNTGTKSTSPSRKYCRANRWFLFISAVFWSSFVVVIGGGGSGTAAAVFLRFDTLFSIF